MVNTINNQLSKSIPFKTQFKLSRTDYNKMIDDTLECISDWNGGRNHLKWDDWKKCHIKVVRTWWNRVKAWKTGDFIFAPLIFQHLHTV